MEAGWPEPQYITVLSMSLVLESAVASAGSFSVDTKVMLDSEWLMMNSIAFLPSES